MLARTPWLFLTLLIGLASTSQVSAQGGLICFQSPVITSFRANPATIFEGNSTTLTWSGFVVTSQPDVCSGANNFNQRIGYRFGPTFPGGASGILTSGDGETASGNSATFLYELPGIYTPTLTATFFWSRPSLTIDLLTLAVIDSHIDNFSSTVTRTTQVTVVAVPEPETFALLLAGLGLLLLAARRKRKRREGQRVKHNKHFAAIYAAAFA